MQFEKIDLRKSVELGSPHPYALLVTKHDDIVNVMGISWYTFVSLKPGKIAFSISNKGYTNELIKQGASVSLCLPTQTINEKAFACGKKTGRNINKIEDIGIELLQYDGFEAPIIGGSLVAWSLKVYQNVEAGDHTLFIADIDSIVGAEVEAHLYAMGVYSRLEPIKNH